MLPVLMFPHEWPGFSYPAMKANAKLDPADQVLIVQPDGYQ